MKKENNSQKEAKEKNFKEEHLVVKKLKVKSPRSKLLVSGISTLLLIAIIISIYFLVTLLLEKVTLPEFDLTENKIYSLSEETKTKLGNLENEITITLINYQEIDSVFNFAEKYKLLNNNIKIETISDITSRKDLIEKYSLDSETQLIVISSGEREKTLNEYNLYTYDYSTYETIDTTEEAFTNAIVDVTTENKPKIYFMNNHIQYDVDQYFYTIIDLMEEDANEVDKVDILSFGSIPEDCNTLIITTLSEDITEFEKDKIIEYINKGGKLLILSGPNMTGKDLSNFYEILSQYGISMEEGIVFEGNSSNMLYGYPDFIVEKMSSSSLTQNLNMNLNICLADAASIKFDTNKKEELNVDFEELVLTSSESFRRTNLNITSPSKVDSDSNQSELIIGGIANKTIDENTSSKLIIFGNELFVSSMRITLNGYDYYLTDLYNNTDIVLNSVAYLNEREDIITIRKSYDSVTYTATQLQHNIIMSIIFITPLVIIIFGIIVWQIRRRKK